VVPAPEWAARYKGTAEFPDAWSTPEFETALKSIAGGTQVDLTGHAIWVENKYWYDGHLLLEASLIRFDQIANIPSLMFVKAPEWQDAYNETIISFIFRMTGLTDIANAFKEFILIKGFSNAMKTFVNTSPPWLVILVGMAPILIGIAIIYIWYKRTKDQLGLEPLFPPKS
jgi:hypothetical protein